MGNFNLTDASALFKNKYEKLSQNAYNSANVLLGRAKKSYNFTGKRMDVAVPLSFQGGVGSRVLPTANKARYEDAIITAKKVYAVCEIDRETIKASMNDEGSFVRGTKHVVQKTVESFNRNMSRILFNDGSAALGTLSADATGTAADPVCVVSAATWNEANWEEKDYINFDADASVFEIVSVVSSTRTVTLSRVSGSLDLTSDGNGAVAYMQNSKDSDPQGLKGVCDATSGSLYSVTVGRRWQAYQKAMGNVVFNTDVLNEAILEQNRRCGENPNMIVTSFDQYRRILNQLEDQKRYTLEPRAENLKGKLSFSGVEFMSSSGPIGIFADRFCQKGRIYLLNDKHIEIYHRPDFGWFDDDGSVFMRTDGDTYEARYGGYLEAYIVPSFQGVITGLAT